MPISRSRVGGIILVGGIAVAAAIFGWFNWRWYNDRQTLEADGVVAVAQIQAATISHKACNSSVQLHWTDAVGNLHAGHFMTCFANRSAGETIPIRYLKRDPEIAMIAAGEGGLPDSQYRTGAMIGAVIALIMAVLACKLVIDRQR